VVYQAIKDVSASYDALVDLLESIEHFLNRLDIYTKIPLPPAVGEILVKIMVELLSTVALVTKQIKQRRCESVPAPLLHWTNCNSVKFTKKLLGETDVEAVLQRLDRLTQDEARTTAAQTLEVVYGLIENTRVVIGSEFTLSIVTRYLLNILPYRWQGIGTRYPGCSRYVCSVRKECQMSDQAIEILHDIASNINKTQRALFPIIKQHYSERCILS
jgi:hypothetical protein